MHLLKPQTFVNRSGVALRGLRAAGAERDAPLADLLVLVDDVALPAGAFRLRAKGSSGGHHGLASIEETVGTRGYPRLRIGVGGPEDLETLSEFVLEPLSRAERAAVEEITPLMVEAVECWLAEGIERAMTRFNRRRRLE